MTRAIRLVFLISIIIAIVCGTLDKALWTNFFLRGGLNVHYVLNMVWADWKYWAWFLLGILVYFKNPWGLLVLLTVVPGNISYFYRIFFLSNHFNDIDWYITLLSAFCSMAMIVLGFIYYGNYFIQKYKKP